MTEALFRIPSRTVTYGYVEVSVDLGHSDPEIIAATYVSWVHAFQKEELATIERLKDAPSGVSDVRLAHAIADSVAESAAIQLLDKELGGVTELDSTEEISDDGQNSDEMPEHKVGDTVTVGGIEFTKHSEMPGGIAPWDDSDLAPRPKPWETDAKLERPELITEDW